jgi:hypothetical protein
MKTLTLTVLSFLLLYTGSYTSNASFKSMKIGLTDSNGKIEYFPDLYVTYTCSNYTNLEGLHMEDNLSHTEVTVNYGGWGRRRGLRQFECKDN